MSRNLFNNKRKNPSLSTIPMNDNISPIDTEHLKKLIRSELEPTWRVYGATPPDMSWVTTTVLEELFKETLCHTRGNQAKAAKILGINRGTFRTKIERISHRDFNRSV